MFRKEFVSVIQKTGMVPSKDLRPLIEDKSPSEISEFKLLNYHFFDDVKFARNVAENYGLVFIDLSNAKVKDRLLSLVKKSDTIKYRMIPVQKTGRAVTVAIYDPSVTEHQMEIQKIFQHPVEFILTNLKAWKKFFDQIKQSADEVLLNMKEVNKDELEESAIEEEDIGEEIMLYVNKLLAEAFIRKASDIHLEPYEQIFRVRFRVDGALQEYDRPDRRMMLPVISRIKILANLDISIRRMPQDGRIGLFIGGRTVDYRVSSIPGLFGEKIVLRVLDSAALQLDMTKLGFEDKQLELFKKKIHAPYGMILVTGPTGSGKTTTLYSTLLELNNPTKNISTAEDPCEFNLPGINQVQVKNDIGLTFAACLRAFLRQDPDIIMVGEIRDFEVGLIAIEAALTGHLVLSTIHTNDAPSTVMRLINMGIEPFLVTGSLGLVVAQRLCRRICPGCKEVDQSVTVDHLISCGLAPQSAQKVKAYKGAGCKTCEGTGYHGRVAIYEVMDMSPMIKELVLRSSSVEEIKYQAVKEGMKTLRMAALTKMAIGETTLQEAVANSGADKFLKP